MSSKIEKKELGQYFTISEELQQFVFDVVKNKNELLLEPSFGAGHLLQKFKEFNTDYPMICYEIDTSIKPIVKLNKQQKVIYGDFTSQNITTKFKTIIGNPPYVKQAKSNNLYIKFIELCYSLLDENGELVFIVPSDFIKLTSASSIINKMKDNGSFTHFLFPNNERLFEGANVDVVVFRYEKGLECDKCLVNGKETLCNITKGIITFSEEKIEGELLENDFNVYVGIVSGKDEIYKVPFGNIEVLMDKNKLEKFIFIDKFPSNNEEIDTHLENNKNLLLERRIKKFTEKNWFEWGAPRNIKTIKENINKKCIYVRTMTRQKEIAFIDTVKYFGGTLLCLIPKNNISDNRLNSIIAYLNSEKFKKDYMYSGRFKIGHKQICNVHIPI